MKTEGTQSSCLYVSSQGFFSYGLLTATGILTLFTLNDRKLQVVAHLIIKLGKNVINSHNMGENSIIRPSQV